LLRAILTLPSISFKLFLTFSVHSNRPYHVTLSNVHILTRCVYRENLNDDTYEASKNLCSYREEEIFSGRQAGVSLGHAQATSFILSWGWGGTESIIISPLYQPRMLDNNDCGTIGVMLGKEGRSTRRKTCPSAALSTTIPILLDPGSNPYRRGGKQATDRLSYGTTGSSKLVARLKPQDDLGSSDGSVGPVSI
jgi:hypothetical protein